MDLPGESYLFNLSLVAMTFATVSALVMLIRQSLGGGLSKFDIHLLTTYISDGFVLSLIALLPPLVSFFMFPLSLVWTISSCLAVLLFLPVVVSVARRRRRASPNPAPLAVKASFAAHGLAILVFLINAVVLPWQGIHLFAAALTFSLAIVMWMFARRIASLFGESKQDGFDPDRA